MARKSLSEKRVFLQWKWYSSVYKTSLAWILAATVLRWLMEITVHELWKNLRYYCIKSTLIKWWALRIREKKDFSKFLRTFALGHPVKNRKRKKKYFSWTWFWKRQQRRKSLKANLNEHCKTYFWVILETCIVRWYQLCDCKEVHLLVNCLLFISMIADQNLFK